jgi:ribosomal protein S18 acetylase RimI-like enzyme
MDFTDIEYRRLTPADEPFLWDMLYLAIHVPDGNLPPPREIVHAPDLARYVEGWGRPGDDGFMALDGEKPTGAVWIRLLTAENKGYGYVDDSTPELSIALLPEYRGLGIGREMITRMLAKALPVYQSVCLSVSRDNPAVRLYSSCGFEIASSDPTTRVMVFRT